MQRININNVITTLLGIILATPIMGFFTVMWQKSSKVDDINSVLRLQDAKIDEMIKQLAIVKSDVVRIDMDFNEPATLPVVNIPEETNGAIFENRFNANNTDTEAPSPINLVIQQPQRVPAQISAQQLIDVEEGLKQKIDKAKYRAAN
jgi:hypothetical protein